MKIKYRRPALLSEIVSRIFLQDFPVSEIYNLLHVFYKKPNFSTTLQGLHLMKDFLYKGDIENSADDFKCLYVNPEHLNLLGTIYVIFYIDKFYLPHILNAYYMIYSEIY